MWLFASGLGRLGATLYDAGGGGSDRWCRLRADTSQGGPHRLPAFVSFRPHAAVRSARSRDSADWIPVLQVPVHVVNAADAKLSRGLP